MGKEFPEVKILDEDEMPLTDQYDVTRHLSGVTNRMLREFGMKNLRMTRFEDKEVEHIKRGVRLAVAVKEFLGKQEGQKVAEVILADIAVLIDAKANRPGNMLFQLQCQLSLPLRLMNRNQLLGMLQRRRSLLRLKASSLNHGNK